MLRRNPFVKGEYYHLYNRGNSKMTIFLDDSDKERFIKLLFLCNGTEHVVFREIPIGRSYGFNRGDALVDIGVYCLMPNHFHLLVREKTDGGITTFMKKLSTSYSMYFNTKYNRSGALFEGRFKSLLVDNEPYFNYVFSYIHLNPVKLINPAWKEEGIQDLEKTKRYIDEYKYSSYYDYFINERPEKVILNKEEFPEHFSQLRDFEDLCHEFTTHSKDESNIPHTKDRPM